MKLNAGKKLKIFCDFDGTASKNDVWLNSLGKFIIDKPAHNDLIEKFVAGEISTRECIKMELDLIENFDLELFNEYISQEQLDPYFTEFYNFCNKRNYGIFIVSEGFDKYIQKMLNDNNLDIPYYCNILNIETDGKLSCSFPHSDENCTHCGVSKRNVLINNTNDLDGEVSVYIGDGVTDYCAVNYADIVFAKDKLASYCWKRNITYFEFKTFFDVMNKIEKLETKNRIKHRQEAKLKRRDVLMGG
ncbi:MAG: HAD-IB family phosphatase [Ignavibacteria bacterium]|nr:HAD-IB family phosphatase [Ignavibacteria bacterium]